MSIKTKNNRRKGYCIYAISILVFLFFPLSGQENQKEIPGGNNILKRYTVNDNNVIDAVKIFRENQYRQTINNLTKTLSGLASGSNDKMAAMELMARSYTALHQHDSSITMFNHILSKPPTQHENLYQTYQGLGYCYQLKGQYGVAIAQYRKALRHAQDSLAKAWMLNYIGGAYWSTGAYQRAIGVYDSALVMLDYANHPLTIKLLNNKANSYKSFGKVDTAMAIHNKALAMAVQQNNLSSEAESFDFIGSVKMYAGRYTEALENFRKALRIRKQMKDTALFLDSYSNIASAFDKLHQYDSAIFYYKNALSIPVDLKEYDKLIWAGNNLAQVYFTLGKYNQAASYYFISLQIAHEVNDINMLAFTYNRLSQLFSKLGNFEKALEYLRLSVEYTEKTNNAATLAYRQNQLGNLYYNNQKYDLALRHYNQSLEIRQRLNNTNDIAQSLNNIGNTFRETGNYGKALEFYQQTLELNKQTNDTIKTCYALNNLGNVYMLTGEKDKALAYFQEAHQCAVNAGVRFIEGLVARKLGDLALESGNQDEAIQFYLASVETGVEINNAVMVSKAYESLYKLFETKGDHKNALKYHKLYSQAQLEQLQEISDMEIYKQQLNFELAQKQDTIQVIENKLQVSRELEKIKTMEANKYKTQRMFLMLIALIFILATGIILYLFRQLKVKNKAIDEAYKNTTIANLKLRKSENVLKELVTTKDKFFSIISHDLRGPISSLMHLTELLVQNADDFTLDELKETNQTIHVSSKNLYALLENLLQWSRLQTGRMKFNVTKIELHKLVRRNMELLQVSAKDKNIQLINNIPDEVTVQGDNEMIDTVLRNLLNNAIKFTAQGGFVKTNYTISPDYHIITVEDNGVGMSDEVKSRLFDISQQVTTSGTNNETGTGLGLLLCYDFIKRHDGNIKVESQQNKGTVFYIHLPIELTSKQENNK